MRRVFFFFLVAAAALLAGRGQQAAAVDNQLLVDVDTATAGIQNSVLISPSAGPFTVQVWVQNVTTPTYCPPLYTQPCGLGAYTIEMTFDANVLTFQSFADGPFLTSTYRSYQYCPVYTPNHKPTNGANSVVSVRCLTTGADPLGPLGSGHLATVTFAPAGVGSTTLAIGQSQLSDIRGMDALCGPSPDTPCAVQNGTVTVNYKADLRVTKSAPASVAAPGTISYTLNVTNLGPDQAQGVSLVDTLPPEVGFSSASPECSYVSGDHKVNCDLGTLTNGQNKAINVTASVAAIQAGKSTLNKADVTTISLDQVSGNNHAQATTQVSASNISISKTAPTDVGLGGAGQYSINVTSTGTSTAAAVVVTDWVPSSVTVIDHGSCSYNSHIVTCTLGDMAPAASATITIGVLFGNTPETVACNTATAQWTPGIRSAGPVCTFVAAPDTDGDGCRDMQERGLDVTKGGLRNPTNPYDFYDITNLSSVVGAKDRAVSGFDLNMLQAYVNSYAGDGGKYDADTNGINGPDGAEMDFAGLVTQWPNSGPDGAISGFDLNDLLAQLNHSCVSAP
jgi:uncharacterized repeat protein (TIGR01451 family)